MAASSASFTNLYASLAKRIYAFLVNKVLLNFFNYKGRSGKLPLFYLLGISLVVTRVETLDLPGETPQNPKGFIATGTSCPALSATPLP